jgi:hypothetical protein
MKLSGQELEEAVFSVAATLLLGMILCGRVSGGLLTVAWCCKAWPAGRRIPARPTGPTPSGVGNPLDLYPQALSFRSE